MCCDHMTSVHLTCATKSSTGDISLEWREGRRTPNTLDEHVSCLQYYYYYYYYFTLGIKDPEGFGKKMEENVSE